MMQNATIAGAGRPWPRAVPCIPAEKCHGCALRGAKLCRAIREMNSSETCRPVIRRFGRGKLIFEQDKTSGFLGVIRRGYARRSTMRMSGKRVLLGLVAPGDIASGLFDDAYSCDLEAATDVEICLYDSVTVKLQMLHNDRLRQLFVQELGDQHRRLLVKVWQYGTLNSHERILAFLISAVEIMPTEPLPDGSLVLSMEIERRDWADLTNTTTETISRTLRYLDEKGLVTRSTPYRFRIHDLDRLATIAGIEPPGRRLGRHDRSEQANRSGETPKSIGRMTTVNALAARTNRLDTVMKPVSAPTRGYSGGKLQYDQE